MMSRSSCRPLLLLAFLLLPSAGLAGCDVFGTDDGNSSLEGVPAERLVALVAAYDETRDGTAVQRLVVADFENPARYDVLEEAGTDVSGTCFSPGKRRILFADQTGSLTGTRSPLKLYDLDTGTARDLAGAPVASTSDGSLECTWSADGESFYYLAAGLAGAAFPMRYDIEAEEARPFGLKTDGQNIYPTYFHGLKGRDTLLASPVGSGYDPDNPGFFYFLSVQSGDPLGRIENEYLRFIPWEDESRAGWRQGAFHVTYGEASRLIAFQRRFDGSDFLATTDLEGNLVTTFPLESVVNNIRWVGSRAVLFDSYPKSPEFGASLSDFRIRVWDHQANEVRVWADPDVIDGAVGIRLPDY